MWDVLAIDPGPEQSAIILWNPAKELILSHSIVLNHAVLDVLYVTRETDLIYSIEMVACYGMPVGKSVFQTVLWIGRFVEAIRHTHPSLRLYLIERLAIKMYFCNSARAKDSNIRQVLVDKFGPPGTKKNPGLTYGLKRDLWQAFALAVYTADNRKEKNDKSIAI